MKENKIQLFYIQLNVAWDENHLQVSSSENCWLCLLLRKFAHGILSTCWKFAVRVAPWPLQAHTHHHSTANGPLRQLNFHPKVVIFLYIKLYMWCTIHNVVLSVMLNSNKHHLHVTNQSSINFIIVRSTVVGSPILLLHLT